MSEIYKSHYTGEEIDEKLASIETLSIEISSMYNRLNTKLINLDDKIDKINTILNIQSESSSEEESEGDSSSPKNIIEKLQNSINEQPIFYGNNSFVKNGQTYPILETYENNAEIFNRGFLCARYKNIVMLKVKWRTQNNNPIFTDGVVGEPVYNITDYPLFKLHHDFTPIASTSGFSDGNNDGEALYAIYGANEEEQYQGVIKLTAFPGGKILGNDGGIHINSENGIWATFIYISRPLT